MRLGIFQKNIRYFLLIVLSFVIFGATVFFGKNAADFFAKATSCPVKNVRASDVGANSTSIAWDTDSSTQGRVEYGTNAQALTSTAPESEAASTHSVPLTLLTPNTIYYYLITIGEIKCDSTGQKCETDTCVPYSFTTKPLAGVSDVTPQATVTSGMISGSPTPTPVSATVSVAPTSSLSLFCKAVQANIGKNEKVTGEWATLKTYDIDGNGIINGLDVIKCQKSGK